MLSKNNNQNPKPKPQTGSIIIFAIIAIFVFSIGLLAVLQQGTVQLVLLRNSSYKEQAFDIAEAGASYYQWHLAHFANDYKDGTNNNGPYLHDFIDKDTNQTIGKFSLQITAPPAGSSIVTIASTGWTLANPNVKRTVTVRYGIPSLAKYAFLTNNGVWIGDTESVSGTMHANGGIRFDGTGNAPITSAKQTYSCPSWQGCSGTKNGIWGAAPQATKNFWQFPVPTIDFYSITANLASIKTGAQSGGIYLPPSNAQGYSLVFNTDGTITVYKVTSLRSTPTGWDVNGNSHNEDIDYNNRSVQFTQNIPSNGLIYIEDKVWVEGTVAGRATVVAAQLPYNAGTAPNIYIPNNIIYKAKDGTNTLGLIAQKDVIITYYAPTNLEVDAAVIAQNGSSQRFYFPGDIKNSITIYGTVGSFDLWTWSWVDGSGNISSGYSTTSTTYDSNLLYGPPPSFPLSTDGYQQISWYTN